MYRRVYIGLLLGICSCLPTAEKKFEFIDQEIPEIYTLITSPRLSKKNNLVYLSNRKYSGYLIELYENEVDTLSIQGFIQGLQSGLEIKWFPGKKIMEQRSYSKGMKNGKQTAFWENGNKKFEFMAKNDAYEGELKEWNYEGRLIHLGNYKNGQEDGAQKLWYDNGKVRANYVIINGKRYGLLGTKNCTNISDSVFVAD